MLVHAVIELFCQTEFAVLHALACAASWTRPALSASPSLEAVASTLLSNSDNDVGESAQNAPMQLIPSRTPRNLSVHGMSRPAFPWRRGDCGDDVMGMDIWCPFLPSGSLITANNMKTSLPITNR
jgi:hypothetical protein